MKRILIVGGGICGLTAALYLQKNGYEVIVAERNNEVGGLSRTYTKEKCSFDSGPHIFHTKNDKVINFIKDILGNELLKTNMFSGVYLLGKYYDWPLKLKVIRQLPFKIMSSTFMDIVTLPFKKRSKNTNTFKDYILKKYGKTLYNIDFDPYTSKFAKLPTSHIHADWAKAGMNRATIDEKIRVDSIFAIIKTAIFHPKEKISFLYPKNGISTFCDNLKNMLLSSGQNIHFNVTPISFEMNNKNIETVKLSDGSVINNIEHIIWTGSICEASELLGLDAPDLEYLNIMTYDIIVKGEAKLPYQYIYYVDEDISFNRIYNTIKISRSNAPKGFYGLCLEVTMRNGDPLLEKPEILYNKIIDDLMKAKIIDNKEDIEKIFHQLLYQAYPIYKLNYRKELKSAFDNIYSCVNNFTLAGRNGLFWYNNMDHSIENAFDTAEGIVKGQRNIAVNELWL